MHTARKYKAIALWNKGSRSYYVLEQQRRAAVDGAPLDAIYYTGSRWQTISDIKNENLKKTLLKELKNV